MPAGITLGDTVYDPIDTNVDDAGSSSDETTDGGSTGGSGTDGVGATASDDADTDSAATDNLGKDTNSSSSSGRSTPQTVLFIVLVGAAMAVMSAWFVKKNQRASSNASQMTPASAPLL